MELLAILSTIILVGTVATLILAVASYILYKARERRGMATSPQAATQQQAQQAMMTAPAHGYQRHQQALPHGGERYPFEEGQRRHAGQPQYQQAPAPRPAQAAAYVPPQHLRAQQGPMQAEHWEYGVESFAPNRRSGQQDALPGRSQNNDLSWLG